MAQTEIIRSVQSYKVITGEIVKNNGKGLNGIKTDPCDTEACKYRCLDAGVPCKKEGGPITINGILICPSQRGPLTAIYQKDHAK